MRRRKERKIVGATVCADYFFVSYYKGVLYADNKILSTKGCTF